MTVELVETDAAVYDVIEIAYFIAVEGSIAASDRVVDAIRATYERLCRNPGIGSRRRTTNPELEGLRMFPVPRYPVYLVFYQATDTQLVIRRVIHGARDVPRVLGEGALA